MSNIDHISAQDFISKLSKQENLDILDIRTNLEFENLSLPCNVTHKPLHEIDPANFFDPRSDKTKPLYVLCKMGPRAQKIAEFLIHHGHQNFVVIDGGIIGCTEGNCSMNTSENPASQPEIMAAVQESVRIFMARYQ